MTEHERFIGLIRETDRIREEHNRMIDCYEIVCDETDCYTCDCEKRADYLLANNVVALPCKVGDMVYTNIAIQGWYLRNKNKPYSGKVVFIGINDSKEMGYGFINVLYNGRNGCIYQFNFSDIGKTVFLTKEEAVKALKGGAEE